MAPTSIDSERKGYSVRLILPGPVAAGGFLIFDPLWAGKPPLKVPLKGRHVRFLRVLARYWHDWPEDDLTGGPPFVPVRQIAAELYTEDELAAAPEEQTVRAYAAQINTLIRKAAAKLGLEESPQVHEPANLLGYRLVANLEISIRKQPGWA